MLVLLVFVPAMGLVLYGNLHQQRAEKARVRESAVATAKIAAARVAYYVKQTRQLLATLTEFPFLTLATNRPFVETHFANLRLLSPDFVDFGLIEKDGTLFCRIPEENSTNEAPDLSVFEAVARQKRFGMGTLYRHPASGEYSLQFGYPVLNEEGEVERVLYASVAVPLLSKALAEIRVPPAGVLNLTDSRGTVLARFPDPEDWVGREIATAAFVRETLAGNEVFEEKGLDGVKRVYAAARLVEAGTPSLFVSVGIPSNLSYAQANQDLVRNIAVMLGVAAVLLMAAWLFSERLFVRPVAAMLSASAKLREGDLSARARVGSGKSELHELAESFNAMAERLEARRAELEAANSEIRQMNADLERRVQERTRQLESANKELEAFSYSVSHDLRAPLRHMDGFARLLSREPAVERAGECQRYIGIITNAARQMGNLIDDLLSFSRMGRETMAIRDVRTSELVRQVIAGIEESTASREIIWEIGELPNVAGDYAMLRQAWVNLISNAVKYTRGRSPARIEIRGDETESEVVFCVADNGAGFDMKYADKLFGVFQRLHREDQFEGTGIGLANVRRIVARHGGRTWAEGKEGEGASFYFSLPVSQSVREEAEDRKFEAVDA